LLKRQRDDDVSSEGQKRKKKAVDEPRLTFPLGVEPTANMIADKAKLDGLDASSVSFDYVANVSPYDCELLHRQFVTMHDSASGNTYHVFLLKKTAQRHQTLDKVLLLTGTFPLKVNDDKKAAEGTHESVTNCYHNRQWVAKKVDNEAQVDCLLRRLNDV
jgi:hypothetical protein